LRRGVVVILSTMVQLNELTGGRVGGNWSFGNGKKTKFQTDE